MVLIVHYVRFIYISTSLHSSPQLVILMSRTLRRSLLACRFRSLYSWKNTAAELSSIMLRSAFLVSIGMYSGAFNVYSNFPAPLFLVSPISVEYSDICVVNLPRKSSSTSVWKSKVQPGERFTQIHIRVTTSFISQFLLTNGLSFSSRVKKDVSTHRTALSGGGELLFPRSIPVTCFSPPISR